jgi:hypothetical protein
MALVGTAHVDFLSIANFLSGDLRARVTATEAALTKVLSLAPNHALAQAWYEPSMPLPRRPAAQRLEQLSSGFVHDGILVLDTA